MRQEFANEVAVANDIEQAAAAVSRILLAWFDALPAEQREKAADWAAGGIRFGMLIAMRGEDQPPGAAIVGVDAEGGVQVLANIGFLKRRFQ